MGRAQVRNGHVKSRPLPRSRLRRELRTGQRHTRSAARPVPRASIVEGADTRKARRASAGPRAGRVGCSAKLGGASRSSAEKFGSNTSYLVGWIVGEQLNRLWTANRDAGEHGCATSFLLRAIALIRNSIESYRTR